MRNLIFSALVTAGMLLAVSSCSSNPTQDSPKPFVTGEEVDPPMGCEELRETQPEADC